MPGQSTNDIVQKLRYFAVKWITSPLNEASKNRDNVITTMTYVWGAISTPKRPVIQPKSKRPRANAAIPQAQLIRVSTFTPEFCCLNWISRAPAATTPQSKGCNPIVWISRTVTRSNGKSAAKTGIQQSVCWSPREVTHLFVSLHFLTTRPTEVENDIATVLEHHLQSASSVASALRTLHTVSPVCVVLTRLEDGAKGTASRETAREVINLAPAGLRGTRDAEEVQDNNDPAPREVPPEQASLLQSDGGVSGAREDTGGDR